MSSTQEHLETLQAISDSAMADSLNDLTPPFDLSPATFLMNPKTGESCFGALSEMKSSSDIVPAGLIYLPAGKILGKNRGFGVRHIWDEHGEQLSKLGYASIYDVALFISDIIQSGAPVHCEFANLKAHRPLILNNKLGQVILEQRWKDRFQILDTTYYTVVTAFRHNRVHGVRIGSVL